MNRKSGYYAKKVGQQFEELIERACKHYLKRKIALIEKTPEPMKMLRAGTRGQVIAAYEKKAQPDFKGTAQGGRSVVFEAKHTSDTRIAFARVAPHQASNLALHDSLGAESFVLVSFQLKRFYNVPIAKWLAMPDELRKKSANEKDLAEFEVVYKNGIVQFLEGER